ncbi:MAG TPA: hypothetical protein VGO47_05695, partial [Chlamydiales bacterium]|nr:hypothetical protein [Chlamydiales bacterium]
PEAPEQSVSWTLDFKSKWIGQNIMDRLPAAETRELCERFLFFKNCMSSSQAAGRCFEQYAIRVIATTSEADNWPLIRMQSEVPGDDAPRFSFATNALLDEKILPKVKRELFPLSFMRKLPTQFMFKNNVYYVPPEPNNPLFDYILITIGDSSAELWVFQMTTSSVHGGSSKGYKRIRSVIHRLKDQLRERQGPVPKAPKSGGKQTASDVVVKVRYILVVPKEAEEDSSKYVWQFPENWNEDVKQNDHRGDVYCLKILTKVHSTFT